MCSDVTVKQLGAHSGEDLEVSERGNDGSNISQHTANPQ